MTLQLFAAMADLTFSRADLFPPGTSLSLWEQAKVGEPWRLKNAVPASATDTATVDGDGSVTFDGAAHQVSYVAGGEVTPVPATGSAEGSGTDWTVTVAATGGTFVLSIDAADTAAIAADATSNQVKDAVDTALSATDTEVVGDAGGPWAITLGASATAVTVDTSSLTAASEWRYMLCSTGNYVAPTRIPHPYGG